MGKGGVVSAGIPEGLKRRHLHIIEARDVKGAVAAVPDVCAGGGEEGVGSGYV
jgi:hypothetical protein